MDERMEELLEQCLFERMQVAYTLVMEENPQLKEIVHEVAMLSREVENAAIGEESRNLINKFLSLSKESDYEYQRYLYIQGCKDCVAFLRGFGVIK